MPLLARGFRGRRLVVLAAVLSVVLSYAGAPPVHAQTEERTTWTGNPDDGTVEVTDASASGSTCIGNADKSPLRLEIVPGGRVSYCFRLSHEALTDDWWVMIKADGSVRGTVGEEGYKGLSWIPSIGRRVDQADSRQWKRVSIAAGKGAVVGTEVTFTCPAKAPPRRTTRGFPRTWSSNRWRREGRSGSLPRPTRKPRKAKASFSASGRCRPEPRPAPPRLPRSVSKTAASRGAASRSAGSSASAARPPHTPSTRSTSGCDVRGTTTRWTRRPSMLRYKCVQAGVPFHQADRWYPSTKTCSGCGAVQSLPLNVRTYRCACGLTLDRDINAARNLAGLVAGSSPETVNGRGERVSRVLPAVLCEASTRAEIAPHLVRSCQT